MPSPLASHEEIERRVLRFVNETLPGLDRRQRVWESVAAETPLFADGRLDSFSILHLLACIEQITGTPVPDHLVVMRNFHSVRAIAATFSQP